MSRPMTNLAEARAAYQDALVKVAAAVLAACPGDHHVVQHRDGNPPWCPRCGRDVVGTPIKEMP